MNLSDLDWNAADSTYTFTSGIAAGAVDSVDIDLQIDPSFMGTSITNNAEISAATNALGQPDEDSTPDSEDGTSAPDGNDNDLAATDGSDDYDPAVVNVGQVFDLALNKVLVTTGTFAPGDTATFRIYVHNQGTIDATSVTVKDIIPAHLILADSDWNAADSTYTFAGGLTAGTFDSIDIDLQIAPDFMGTSITNNAEISAATNALGQPDADSTPDSEDGTSAPDANDNDLAAIDGSDDYDPAPITVGQTFDLALNKVLVSTGTFAPGDTATFRIYVYNQGTLDATSVTVKDIIPADLVLADSDWDAADSSYTFAGGLTAGAVDSVDIDVQINPAFMGTSITNNAEIASATNALGQPDADSTPDTEDETSAPDGNDNDLLATDGSDDYDPAVVNVGQVFDLALNKVLVSTGALAPGDTATFRIYVYNQGSVDASSVTVKDILPVDLILADADWAADSTYTFAGGITAGAVDSVDIDVQINPAFMGTSITNNAEIAAATNALGPVSYTHLTLPTTPYV